MKQSHRLILERRADIPECDILNLGERKWLFGREIAVVVISRIQSAYHHFLLFAQFFLDKFAKHGRIVACCFEQLILRYKIGIGLLQAVAHIEQFHEEFLLPLRAFQLVEGFSQHGISFHTDICAQWRNENLDISACLWFEILPYYSCLTTLGFQFGRQCCFHHVSNRAHVVFGNPLPEGVLRMTDDCGTIGKLCHVFYLNAFRGMRSDAHDDAGVMMLLAKRHYDAHADTGTGSLLFCQAISEGLCQWHRQYAFSV